MKKAKGLIYVFLLSAGIYSCNNDIISSSYINESSFTESAGGWLVNVVDYDTATGKDSLKVTAQVASFPSPLSTSGKALLVRSSNYGPSLFTFLTKQITGLEPDRPYAFQVETDLITRYPQDDSLDFVTTPETRIFLKAAVSNFLPETEEKDGIISLNMDKGSPGVAGKDFILLADLTFPVDTVYAIQKFSTTENALTVTPDSNGNAWISIGTETAYKGQTVVYYDRIKINIQAQEKND